MNSRVMGILGCALALAWSAQAFAQTTEDTEKYVRVLQQRPFVKALRFEIQPGVGVPLNDDFTRSVIASAGARFHITEEWSIGVDYLKYFNYNTDLDTEIANDYGMYSEKNRSLRDFYVGGNVSYVPISGKFLWFGRYGSPSHWDLYLLAGGGASHTLFRGYHGTGMFGAGFRASLAEWITWNVELRDYLYMESFARERKFQNNVVLTTGFAIFLPFSHDYVYPK
jgi:outer membrane beta-barrel protein